MHRSRCTHVSAIGNGCQSDKEPHTIETKNPYAAEYHWNRTIEDCSAWYLLLDVMSQPYIVDIFNLLLGSTEESDTSYEQKSNAFWSEEIEAELYKHFVGFPRREQLIEEYEEEASDMDTRIMNATAASVCTFSVTGWDFADQSYYTCYTYVFCTVTVW